MVLPPLSTIIAVLGYLGGILGTVFGAINVGNWTSAEQATITAVGGVIAIVTHHHVTAKAVGTSARVIPVRQVPAGTVAARPPAALSLDT
jgi:hypothetical protein